MNILTAEDPVEYELEGVGQVQVREDIGYTFEVGRKFHNGIKMSAFFTRTDVPKRLYGEGSFDKGVKFTIPFSFFGNKNSLSNYEWHPLTKDPGALLIKGINLNQNIERFRVY